MKALLEGLKALGPARIAVLAAVAIGMFGILALMTLRGTTDQMALLYGDLDTRDASQMVDVLGRNHIAYRVTPSGNQIMVPADQVPETRLMLARRAALRRLDRLRNLRPRRRLGTASSRTSTTPARWKASSRAPFAPSSGVRGARVHLVLPHREPFARERRSPGRASCSPARRRLGSTAGVQAILNLVAAAVPGLKPQNIAIVDCAGNLLARGGTGDAAARSCPTRGARVTPPTRIARAVEEMLEQSLGPGKVRAEAAVRMDFDRINETPRATIPTARWRAARRR